MARSRDELTEKQNLLLDNIWACNGDPIKAALKAGYGDPYEAVKALKEEIIEMAKDAMARLSTKAIANLENVLDSDSPIKGASDKLKAAQLILDRTDPKTEKVEVSTEKGAIFILPEKREFASE